MSVESSGSDGPGLQTHVNELFDAPRAPARSECGPAVGASSALELISDPARPGPDTLREECGVFAMYNVDDAARLIAFGLQGLQHRGQEGCGVAISDGRRLVARRRMGLVGEHFSSPELARQMPGRAGIGHVRYSTQGRSVERNLQPINSTLHLGEFAIAHNGNLVNALELRHQLVARGSLFQTESDTEVINHLMALSSADTMEDRFREALLEIKGGYALVGLSAGAVYAARDPIGIRPLCLGRLGAGYVIASESTAFGLVGATFERDIAPGEVLVIDEDGPRSFPTTQARPNTCAFEYIYFARPDSKIDGVSVYNARERMGRALAAEFPIYHADIVVPVPDSGVPAAIGYAEEAGLRYRLGIIRSHFVGRTFIQPGQGARDLKVLLKHRANPEVLRDKVVVLVDDSIVRGTTSAKIVDMVRQAGAKEVHLLSASPQIKHPDFYGIDMPRKEELFAANTGSLDEMRRRLNVDTLGFLSLEGLYRAILETERDPDNPQLTEHYFTGVYPIAPPPTVEGARADDPQMPLLVDDL